MNDFRDRIATEACDILDRFERLNVDDLEGGIHTADSVSALSGLLGCDFHLLSDSSSDAERGISDRAVFNPTKDGQRATDLAGVTWPIDIATIVRKDSGYSLQRVVTARPQELRGITKLVPHKAVFAYSGVLSDNGRWWAQRNICGLLAGNWTPIDVDKTILRGGVVRTYTDNADHRSKMARSVAMAFSLALTERYQWHAAFGAYEGPRLLLPTSSAGAANMFKDRDKLAAHSRRSALRHWVNNHFRSAEENITYVRDHLRGATKFFWKDLPCELMVSEFDMEKNEFFRLQASEWRARRKHNSVRVRLKKAS